MVEIAEAEIPLLLVPKMGQKSKKAVSYNSHYAFNQHLYLDSVPFPVFHTPYLLFVYGLSF